jgi:hypothetical protein
MLRLRAVVVRCPFPSPALQTAAIGVERLLLAPTLYSGPLNTSYNGFDATKGRFCATVQRFGVVHRSLTLTHPPTSANHVRRRSDLAHDCACISLHCLQVAVASRLHIAHMLAYLCFPRSSIFFPGSLLSSVIVHAFAPCAWNGGLQVRQQLDVEIPAVFPSYDGTFQATSLLFVELIPQYLTCRTCPCIARECS